MKNLILFMLFFLTYSAFAQKTYDYFLGKIPSQPQSVCNTLNDDKTAFLNKVTELIEEIKAETDKLSNELSNTDRDKIAQEQLKKQGINIPESELQDVENMSDAEKEALAKKIMSQKKGKTPTITKQKYQQTKEETEFLRKFQDPNGNGFSGKAESIRKKLKAIDDEYHKNHEKETEPILREMNKININEGATAADISKYNSLKKQLSNIKLKLCEKYSAQNSELTNKYLILIKDEIGNIRKAEEISMRELGQPSKDLSAINAVSGYLGLLKNIFKFDSRTEEEKTTSY